MFLRRNIYSYFHIFLRINPELAMHASVVTSVIGSQVVTFLYDLSRDQKKVSSASILLADMISTQSGQRSTRLLTSTQSHPP